MLRLLDPGIGHLHLLFSHLRRRWGSSAGSAVETRAAPYPEHLLRFLPGGELVQRAISLTPSQASCDVRDITEICVESDKKIQKSEFGHLKKIVTTGL